MADPAHTYVQPHERASRLHELGLREEWIFEAVRIGLAARKAVTAFHPPIYGGVSQWAETHRGLREQSVPFGWEADDGGNFSTVIRADGRVAVTVATGTDRTGIPGYPEPMTKYPRGPMTHAAVERNVQLTIPFFATGVDEDDEEEVVPTTWYLLIHTRHDEVRFELSCPRHVADDSRIDSWSERIIIPPLDTDAVFGDHRDDDDPGSIGGPIDVPVEPL